MNVINYESTCGGCGTELSTGAMQTSELLTLQPRAAKSSPSITTWLCEECTGHLKAGIKLALETLRNTSDVR